MFKQQIGFVRVGGARVAYATAGSGPPLVLPPGSFGHLALELDAERMRRFFEAITSRFTLVRYDRPGTGLSDRDRQADSFSLEFEVDALDVLTSELGLGRMSLFGFSYGGVVAAAFAALRPERVRRLLLFGVYPTGAEVTSPPLLRSVTAVLRADWELGSRLLAEAFLPDADREEAAFFARLRRESCSGETAASLLEMWSRADLRDLAGHITAPTLVLHRRDDQVVPMKLGRAVAALVPGAQFEMLEGRWHQPWSGDACAVLRTAGAFLGFAPPQQPEGGTSGHPLTLTARETEVLQLIADGLSDSTIAERLVVSAHTVHRHVANIRARLGQPSRAAAAAHAARLGLI